MIHLTLGYRVLTSFATTSPTPGWLAGRSPSGLASTVHLNCCTVLLFKWFCSSGLTSSVHQNYCTLLFKWFCSSGLTSSQDSTDSQIGFMAGGERRGYSILNLKRILVCINFNNNQVIYHYEHNCTVYFLPRCFQANLDLVCKKIILILKCLFCSPLLSQYSPLSAFRDCEIRVSETQESVPQVRFRHEDNKHHHLGRRWDREFELWSYQHQFTSFTYFD